MQVSEILRPRIGDSEQQLANVIDTAFRSAPSLVIIEGIEGLNRDAAGHSTSGSDRYGTRSRLITILRHGMDRSRYEAIRSEKGNNGLHPVIFAVILGGEENKVPQQLLATHRVSKVFDLRYLNKAEATELWESRLRHHNLQAHCSADLSNDAHFCAADIVSRVQELTLEVLRDRVDALKAVTAGEI